MRMKKYMHQKKATRRQILPSGQEGEGRGGHAQLTNRTREKLEALTNRTREKLEALKNATRRQVLLSGQEREERGGPCLRAHAKNLFHFRTRAGGMVCLMKNICFIFE